MNPFESAARKFDEAAARVHAKAEEGVVVVEKDGRLVEVATPEAATRFRTAKELAGLAADMRDLAQEEAKT